MTSVGSEPSVSRGSFWVPITARSTASSNAGLPLYLVIFWLRIEPSTPSRTSMSGGWIPLIESV